MLANQRRSLVNRALGIFERTKNYVPEKARAYFLKGQILIHNHEEGSEETFDQAVQLYRQSHPGDTRAWSELELDDFSEDIIFWSR